jgi:hypothetical protein
MHPAHLLHRILDLLSGRWLNLILELFAFLARAHAQPVGLYEILSYDSTLDLYDPSGERSVVRKQQRMRFSQNDITTFEDIVYGDGRILAGYRVAPGRAVDCYRDGDRWHVLISLRTAKHRGDVTTVTVERQIEGGFIQDEEWWQIELRHPTRRLRLTVLFPATRPCRHATLQRRSTRRVTELGRDAIHDQPDGRQRLVWECQDVRPLEIFTLRWRW